MKNASLVICCIILIFSLCAKKDEKISKPPAVQKIPFIPPKDSSITKEQMQKWLNCTTLLDSLCIVYSDSFETKDPGKHLAYQEQFVNAQDTLCVKNGLLGGHDEYIWISQYIGLEKNSYLLDSADNSRFSE